ncbi:hypothetical protein Angca_008912, partial [Angiostrongylus cantonensis]
QAGFRKGFSAMDHTHTLTRLIGVSREYKRRLCLTFIDLEKAFDSIEIKAVVPFTLNRTNISECSSYVYLGRKINMKNDLAPELCRRKRAAWGPFKSIEDVVKRTKNIRLRAHLFEATVLPALTYASETWSLRKQDERSLSVNE